MSSSIIACRQVATVNNTRLFSPVVDRSRCEFVLTVIVPRQFSRTGHPCNHARKWMNQLKPLTLFLRHRYDWSKVGIIVFSVNMSLQIMFSRKILFTNRTRPTHSLFHYLWYNQSVLDVNECWSIESLSMTFTADGKRQRLPLIFYSFLVILKQIIQKWKTVSYYSLPIEMFWFHCTGCWRQTAKVSFLPFAVSRKRHA